MKNCKKKFVVIAFITLNNFFLFFGSYNVSWAVDVLTEIDPHGQIPPPLESLLYSLKMRDSDIQTITAKNGKEKGVSLHAVGVSYELKGGIPRETLIDIYKHAAIYGSYKAWYSLGQHYYAKNERQKANNCFSYLSQLDAPLFLRLEETYGNWAHAYPLACKLWTEGNPLCIKLLEEVYKSFSKKRCEAAHYLAKAYAIRKSGFPYDLEKAKHWLAISADLGNLEDQYLLAELDYQTKGTLESCIVNVRSLVDTSIIKAKRGVVPKFFLARLLVEFANLQQINEHIQEALFWLLKAFEETSQLARPIIWTTKSGTVGTFDNIEVHRQLSIASASDTLTKCRNLYELGFDYLSVSNGQELTILTKARESFLQSYQLGKDLPSYFCTNLIQYYLTLYNPSFLIPTHAGLYSVEPFLSLREVLMRGDSSYLKKLLSDFPISRFKGHAALIALFYRRGLYAISPSKEHEIFFLKVAAETGDTIAKKVLAYDYPLAVPLTDRQQEDLIRSRTYFNGKPKIVVVGGGDSGVLTAILLAKLAREGKISIGEICLVEKNSVLFQGASELPSRLHLGGEYSKHFATAFQCMVGAVLFRQVFQTDRVLTPVLFNDFLLSLESLTSTQPDFHHNEADFISHFQHLNELYANCLGQFKDKVSAESAEKLLFGSLPFFHKIEGEEWKRLQVDHHFASGVRTKERGIQAVGLGVVLEFLLNMYNVRVEYGYQVEDIQPLPGGGVVINSNSHFPLYARYIINAAWDNNSQLEWLIKRHDSRGTSLLHSGPPKPIRQVFLRSLALVDISRVDFPYDSSFFGLVGSSGGMVSRFNGSFATIFIPKQGLSYQGQYLLSSTSGYPHVLPSQAATICDELKLEDNQIKLASKILEDAQLKYHCLENARVLGLITHTTLSENDEIYKRTHSNAYWVEGTDALQICANKTTFASLVACQVIARLAFDRASDFRPNFTALELEYLTQYRGETAVKAEMPVGNICLPESFTLIHDDSFMDSTTFLEKMRTYAFRRRLPFTIFEESEEARASGRDPSMQFALITRNTNLTVLDLSSFLLPAPIIDTLLKSLQKNKNLEVIKLGQLNEINDDDEDEVGGEILSCLVRAPTLQSVTLKGWNLSFSKRYKPLAALIPKLKIISFNNDVTFNTLGIEYLCKTTSNLSSLESLTVRNGALTKQTLRELLTLAKQAPNLTYLDLAGNNMGDSFLKPLADLISYLSQLRGIDISRNQLLDSFELEIGAPQKLPLSLEAHPFTSSIALHPNLETVNVNGNGPISSVLQERIDFKRLTFLLQQKQ